MTMFHCTTLMLHLALGKCSSLLNVEEKKYSFFLLILVLLDSILKKKCCYKHSAQENYFHDHVTVHHINVTFSSGQTL
jgi:hypothetical protein